MKFLKINVIIILILCPLIKVQSQNSQLEKLKEIKEQLIIEKQVISDSIKTIDIEINLIKSQKNKSNILTGEFIRTQVRSDADIMDEPSINGNVIGNIPKYEFIQVYTMENEYWAIKYDSITGYVWDNLISNKLELNERRENNRGAKLRERYGNEIATKIIEKRYWIGMTREMARESLGKPHKINESSGSYGVHEQWVYDKRNLYLYFESGKLTSYQK